MDIKSPDVFFLGSTFEESDPRVIDGRSRTTVSMRKAHFMDKHPIRSLVSMIKAHFMDEHPTRSSVSMRKAHFMV